MIERVDIDEAGKQALLKQVLKDVCEQERIWHHSAMADEIARQLLQLFMAGTHDRDGLLALIHLRMLRGAQRRKVFRRGPPNLLE